MDGAVAHKECWTRDAPGEMLAHQLLAGGVGLDVTPLKAGF